VLDAKNTPSVDEKWCYPEKAEDEERSQKSDPDDEGASSIRPGVAHIERQPKIYSYSGRKIGEGQIDFELARSWRRYCGEKYAGCNAYSDEGLSQLKAINIYERLVVKAPSPCRYVALSYVWGSISITNVKTVYPETLPQTIEDAIIAVKELGESYLGVDALYISQDYPEEKKAQF
jgi:hypothetical protein